MLRQFYSTESAGSSANPNKCSGLLIGCVGSGTRLLEAAARSVSAYIRCSSGGGHIYQARLHYDIDGHREFVHSETGIRTLKAEFDKVASHNEHHLEQIDLALKGFGA